MTTVGLKPNVQDLQAEVIKLLEDISCLMDRASKALSTDSSSERYIQYRQEVAEESDKVRHLELRMAIVAPMKAGKSTIINAIAGQDLLPSRNAAMTTLPTEIVFKANEPEPVLILPPETLSISKKAYRSLEYKIRNRGIEGIYEQLAEYPHLHRLVQKIQTTVEFSTEITTRGHAEIIETLMDLNDIVRLSSFLESKDLLNQLIDAPRIETPFWQAELSEESKVLGNLVIVDTPGPNEATSSEETSSSFKLARVVKEQLRKSSIVLIVLDFTQLKTEAAEKVKRDVQQVIHLRGKENLYVLVNKVDQRLDNDMDSGQVQQFVAAEFGIGDDGNNRVFEISARFAFSAANFIQELAQTPSVTVAAMRSAETLARQVYGRKWEKELKRAVERNDTEDLQDEAYLLWEDSGFDTFMKRAVSALIERAAPKCIKSALSLSKNRLAQLQEDLKLRSQGIAKEADELQRQVDELEVDLERLNACHARLNDVSQIKADLYHRLNQTLSTLQRNAQVSLEIYWDQEEYQRADFVEKRRIEIGNFASWITKQLGIKIDKGDSLIECKTESEAEEFARQAINFVKQRMGGLLEESREEARHLTEIAGRRLIERLESETKPIIEKARQRLHEALDIDFVPPDFSLSFDDAEISKPRINSQHRYVDQGYEFRRVKKRSFWHWVWVVPYEETQKIKRPDKREDYYTVSLEELTEEINQSITTKISILAQDISKYVDEDFQDRINLFFENLDSYLRRYKESLRQAQADKKLSQDEKVQLVAELSSLIPEAALQLQRTYEYSQYADDLLEGMQWVPLPLRPVKQLKSLIDLQQRIPVVADKVLVDLVNGLDVSRDTIRYQKGRSFLRWLADKVSGKDEKLQSLLNSNFVVGQGALHQWMLELCDSLRISQVALQATQESLLEVRSAIRRQHERVQMQEGRLQALYQHLELLSAQVNSRFDLIEERISQVELRVAARDDLERILAAWLSEQTYKKLPWAIQIALLVREVFSSTVIAYELRSGDTILFRELLTNRLLAASRQMPRSFFGLADLLEDSWTSVVESDRNLVAGLLEIRSIPQYRLQRMPYLFTLGTMLELATLSSEARPTRPAQCAIELCRNQIDDISAVTDTRKFVSRLIQETADDCLNIMVGSLRP